MNALYTRTRRLFAGILLVSVLVFAALRFVQRIDSVSYIVAGVSAASAILLVGVIGTRRARLGVDLLAFLVTALAVAVAWGASVLGFVAYIIPIAIAIVFATVALVLRTEASTAVTKDRL